MEIINIVVEYPSGMVITDRATFIRDLGSVAPSERLASILRELAVSEAPPSVTAVIDAVCVRLDAHVDGSFAVTQRKEAADTPRSGFFRLVLGHSWSKDQRQQFGRFAHTLSAASVAGAVGYSHSADVWTLSVFWNVAALVLISVVLFLVGMDSMNGE